MTEQIVNAEAATAWTVFGAYERSSAFLGAWLTLQCESLTGVERGWLFLAAGETEETAAPIVYPSGAGTRSDSAVDDIVEQSRELGQGIVLPGGAEGTPALLAYPITDDGAVLAVVVVRLSVADTAMLEPAMRQLQWGAGWVLDWTRRQQRFSGRADPVDVAEVFKVFAAAVGPEAFGEACAALTTQLADLLSLDRASLGFQRRHRMRIVAVSHASQTDPRTDTVRRIQEAMTEAADQSAVIVVPRGPVDDGIITKRHEAVLAALDGGGVATFPLASGDRVVGALTLEKGSAFSRRELDLCDAIATLSGPVLEEKRRNDRMLPAKVADTAAGQLAKLLGPRYLLRKLIALALIATVGAAVFAKATYQVSAPAVTEAEARRVVAAPFDGYLLESHVRPGDTVKVGQALAGFDTAELVLERLGVQADRNQRSIKYQDAIGKYELAQAKVLKAEIQQLDARLELLDSRLRRSTIRAPIDGFVVSGDLSQSIGEPMSTGQELFTLAPLSAFRLVVKVDERDIADIAPSQAGSVVLAALPDQAFGFRVRRVTPVLEALDGRNAYRIEARFDDISERFRPGLEGRARIDVGERNLFWIWTHEIVAWLRLQAWAWLP